MTRRLTARTTAVFAVLVSLVTFGLSGCSAFDSSPAKINSDTFRVVTTTTQVTDFTRELLGNAAKITELIGPGQSAHHFDPTAAQLTAIGEADAIVKNGAGLEPWLEDVVQASGFHGKIIDASTGITLHSTDAEHEPQESTHEATPSAHEDHGAGNPHIWTDPSLAMKMVSNIADGLKSQSSKLSDLIAKNESAYLTKLKKLDDWIRASISQTPPSQRLLVSNHDAFTYFVEAYDIVFVGSVIPGFDDNAEPSAAEIDTLAAKIRATGVKAVFSEASISPKAAETLAAEAGVKVYSGEDALYGDSLGLPGSEGATYISSTEHNVRLIVESWGRTVSKLAIG